MNTFFLLAAPQELDQDLVTPGALGFLVIALIGVAVWFLARSLSKQLRRVNFEERPDRPERGDNSAGNAPGNGGQHPAGA
ncbi:hypothetical protein [Allostreptomyces psammosilenae]|uniref:Uncharacterized protein n=1 Tax=Allostreptomyces psammosilenae TaxID=1892865 RepID=A0A852ZZD6_9ACTN|nr:hypothetical protein [Allostreptomyces psammosilenae]NYI06054.1 hypothetical protein [Allostreptomyces psammosilenae]